ncbi:hypothetical protein PHYBOEH_006542 [Phytophthora boehmeriae]|uniref:EF-hand domain-containing protein n=1 Tax=Phytophthora boehmeriae TaxID=109152 RepID=A0A8T1WF89_9STRA|nr:hypothetical protein PHYBOEH_006542 [Phytophthora boehmeriae]
MAVYVYGFSASVPSTIAYIMGGHLGGSFRTTVNRVGGVVAGSVVPSVFKFFFVQICEPEFLGVVLSDIVMFVWVGMCMYVYFGRGYSSYAGVVAAFISSDALMRQTDICYPDGSDSTKSIAIASYSSLAQTSVAVIIFIVVECFILPKSAISMLRQNILDSLKLHQRVFNLLFGHHLSSSVAMDESTMTEVRKILQVQLPCKFAAQRQLLIDAQAEPLLWRPAFSADKHKRILEISHRLLNNNYLLFKLVRWFHFRVTQNRVKLDSADIRNEDLESLDDTSAICHEKWQISCNHFQLLVQDNFETMEMVFSDSFQYSDPDEMAVFMQMKEAFRLADKDCSGELNADDVANMLETVFAQSGAVKKEEIGLYVQQFMALVGKPDRETVSFEEFMSALEHGLKLEVEVYRRRKPRVAIPVINTLQTKEEMQSGDPNELETSRCSACSWEDASMLLRREYDVLNVEDFLISEVVAHMKSAYVEWLMADQRYARVSMEEQLLLNCLVSSAESIAKSLAGLEEVALT